MSNFENNINDFIYKKNYIDISTCNFIINEIKDKNWSTHQYFDKKNNVCISDKETELQVLFINNNITNFLYEKIFLAIENYKNKFNCMDFCENVSDIRLNRYQKNNNMKIHVDHIRDIFDGKNVGIPIISIVGVLNDNYKGGDFIFNENYKINLNAGDILIFPSNFMYKHQVSTVFDNTRYSYVCWGY